LETIEFKKFINESNIEFHWGVNPDTDKKDVIFFPSFFMAQELSQLLGNSAFEDEGIPCTMRYGYLALWASVILDSHGIELTEIFGQETNDS
jgi:hypothetical protein